MPTKIYIKKEYSNFIEKKFNLFVLKIYFGALFLGRFGIKLKTKKNIPKVLGIFFFFFALKNYFFEKIIFFLGFFLLLPEGRHKQYNHCCDF